VKAIRSLRDLLPQDDIAVWGLELDSVVELTVMLVCGLVRVDHLVLDVTADVAQGRVLEVAPEGVDELVGERGPRLGGTGEGGKDSDEELCSSWRC
jgi:hypothetical protein